MAVSPGFSSVRMSNLIIGKLGGVLKVHLLQLQWGVTSGQGQATQGVTASTPVPDDSQNLLLDGVGQRHTGGADTHIGAPVNHTLRSTLGMKQEDCKGGTETNNFGLFFNIYSICYNFFFKGKMQIPTELFFRNFYTKKLKMSALSYYISTKSF